MIDKQSYIYQIVESIEFTSGGQFFVNGEVFFALFLFDLSDKNRTYKIKKALSEQIYSNFYIKADEKNKGEPNDNFFKSLKNANKSRTRLIGGYKRVFCDIDGSIIVEKYGFRKRIMAGMYIFEDNQIDDLIINRKVKILMNKELLNLDNSFYYILGVTPNVDFPEAFIRIYFNLKPNGSFYLIEKLTKDLNKLKIPFHFKCLKKPEDYIRADSGVLYLDKRYFFDFKPILKEIIKEINSFLNPQTPLFTLKLHDGIGFAENPPNPNESFGMSRCRLIAEGIWQAHENNLLKSEWANCVINYIESQGYDLEKFYLNPNSRFPYEF